MSTRRRFTNYLVVITLVAMSALLWSCKADSPVLTSSLSLHFTSDVEARTLKPDTLNLSVETYDINGTGPNGAIFAFTGITTETYLLENLVPGSWSVTAKGKNADGIVIVQSVATAIVLTSANNSLRLELLPLTGMGTFSLELSWPVSTVSVPEIIAVLTPDVGDPITLNFVITGTSAVIAPLSIPRGYYELSLKLNDASSDPYLVWSKVETVLIFADATTSKNWTLVKAEMNSPIPQNLGLILVADAKSPIEIVLSGVTEKLEYDTNMTVTATGTPTPTSWKWFLDGDVLIGQTAASVTIGAGLVENTLHTLTAIGRAEGIAGSTDATFRIGIAPIIILAVDLKTAGNYVILAQSAISGNVGTQVVGDIGVSPVSATAITGFGLILDPSNKFSKSTFVNGSVFASDYAVPTPTELTQAVIDSNAAYAEAAARVLSPGIVDNLMGEIGGKTLVPGLYKWDQAVSITTNLTIEGPAHGVWIFQITGSLESAAGAQVLLAGGAQAKNIFWQVEGGVLLGANSHMEGVILSGSAIAFGAGATANGRLYAKSAVTLDSATVTQPLIQTN